jgi:Xaa-Pro aminopeptidase
MGAARRKQVEETMVRRMSRYAGLAILLFSWLLPKGVLAQAGPEELQKRRQAVRDALEPGGVLVLRAPAPGEYSFRQDSNIFYLTGLESPGVSLILYSSKQTPGTRPAVATASGAAVRRNVGEILFMQPPPQTGPVVRTVSGAMPEPPALQPPPAFAAVRPASDFDRTFESVLLSSPSVLYVDYQRSRGLTSPLTTDEQLFKAARDRGATFAVKSITSVIGPLRAVKSDEEVAIIQHATDITARAEREVMKAARPGMFEYQLQAIIEFTFAANGARRVGFPSIIGSGMNGTILHWMENTRQTQPGDLVVMDIGAEYGMYSSDITRTIPVNGKFTERQRQVYEVVLKANEEAIAMVAPGVSMRDVSAKASDVLAEGLMKLGVITDRKQLFEYYYHGLSHNLGLDVHDIGPLAELKPGMVVTIEPGLYFRKEGFGIRVEDDVLVTPTGHRVLSAAAPKTVAEIEALMKEDGLDIGKVLIPTRPASPAGAGARQ